MLNRLTPAVALLLGIHPLAAQSEPALREYFEGKTVTVRQQMPGTEEGVDIYPGTDTPLDYPKYAGRLKEHGTALRSGQSALVTKVKVKSKHIEFQLDGGGYGTMGDETSTNISTGATPKTRREKNVEAEVKREADPVKKRAIREELDDLKREREREDARNRALTPEAVMSALAQYVDFGQLRSTAPAPADTREQIGPQPDRRGGLPRKGMLAQAVNAQLGPPITSQERKEGTLKVQRREYTTADGRVTAEFVEGVLIRFTVTSE